MKKNPLSSLTVKSQKSPSVGSNIFICRRIADDIEDFGAEPPRIYAQADSLPFRQTWISQIAMPRESGRAWTGYDETHLRFYALVEDSDIITRAAADNQLMWTLGDTVEFFLKPGRDQDFYTEIHVSPNGYLMDLGIPSRWKFFHKEIGMDDVIKFESRSMRRAMTFPDWKCWAVELRVPWVSFGIAGLPAPGSVWQAAVCRYNYRSDRKRPELSSTAFLKERNFHRYEEYHDLVFE